MLLQFGLGSKQDVIIASALARRIARSLNINDEEQTRIVAAAAEIAHEVIVSGGGTAEFSIEGTRPVSLVMRVRLESRNAGKRVMSGGGYGTDLPGTMYAAKQIVDAFEITPTDEGGTVLRMAKVLPFNVEVTDWNVRRLQKQLAKIETEDLVEEFLLQHQEFLLALEGRIAVQRQLAELQRELAHTNLGVVALNAELEQQAEETRKQAEFERHLIGIVSHDLRNPISNIVLSAKLLLSSKSGKQESHWGVKLILSSAERALRLMEDLLDFTKARISGEIPIRPRETDLNDLVETVVAEVQIAHQQRAIVYMPSGDITVSCDPDRMAQILINLLANSLQYSPEDTPIEIRTWKEDGEVGFEIHNYGPPIPADLIGSIFQAFRRGPAATTHRGVGLGLYIVSEIVRGHGGTISVESSPEKGTAFTVRLPCDKPKP